MMKIEYLQLIKQLRLMDNDFMYLVFRDNIECVELLLSIIFKKYIPIDEYHIEHKIVNTNGRSVTLDILVKSGDHIINIEIQRDDKGANPKRARYHQSMVDVYESYAKITWNKLAKITTVFICEKDYFKKGKPIYHIASFDEETKDKVNDEAEYIYVNGEYVGNDEIGKLMHDFRATDYREMYYDVLKEKVKYLKESEGGQKKMCEIFEQLKEQGRLEGRLEGKEEGRLEERQKMSKAFEELKEQALFEKSLNNIHKLVYKMYQKKAKWLDQCSLQQLDKAFDLALNQVNYRKLKAEVLGQ